MPAVPPERAAAHTSPVLFGRARHLAEISRVAASVDSGAQIVLIEGESGFGKTALLREAMAILPAWPRYQATADVYERALPYGVLNQLLAPFDQALLPPVLAGGIDPDVSTLTAGAALLALIDGSEGATIVTVDDAQWIDEQSSRALWFAARRSFHDRLLMLIAARPAATELLTHVRRLVIDGARGIRVDVDGLSVGDATELATARLGVPLPRRTARRLIDATDGNALHLHAILDRVASAADPIVDIERRLGDGVLPLAPGFEAITREAMERLGDGAHTVVSLVAVFGGTVTASLLTAAASHLPGRDVTEDAIDEAVASGLVDAVQSNGPVELRLRHQRVGDAVLTGLSLRARRELHRAVATVVEGDSALRHLVRSSAGPDDGLAVTLDRAADKALRHHESERAVRYAFWASSLSSEPEDRHERLIRAGLSAIATQHFGLLVGAIPEFSNLPVGVERDLLLGSATFALDDVQAARMALARAAHSNPTDSQEQVIVALANLAVAYLEIEARRFDVVCRAADAVIETVSAIRSARSSSPEPFGIDLTEVEGIALTWRTLALWRSGAAEPVDAELTEHINRGLASGFGPRHALMFIVRGGIRRQQGRLDEAIADLEQGIELADTIRPALAPFGRIELALAQFRQGRWDDAAMSAAVAVSLADDFGGLWTYGNCHLVVALVPVARGEMQPTAIQVPDTGAGRPATDDSIRMLIEAVAARAAGDRAAVIRVARTAMTTLDPRSQVDRGWWMELAEEAVAPQRRTAVARDPLSVLSGREREVAHLAAQGLTNREVAQRLFVTVKGVEYHMGNVLAKLHLTSRRGIRTLLDGRGTSPLGESERTMTRDAP